MFLCVFTAAAGASAISLVLIFAGRCFLLFEFPAGEVTKGREFIPAPPLPAALDYNSIAETENIPTAS